MPCYKGIAVSIHANGAPVPEYGIQKQSRLSRINTYIPVPQPQINPASNKPEAAKFAISITLLTPGLAIPYSTPRATESNPYPKPQFVGALPSNSGGKYDGIVPPYVPMTNSENETIAAYIYFDGRAKEEVATLLRPGEETWVNSRWVQVPQSEGGGLAEREFLFREVGLERWLNGLDLKGHDAAEKLERRRQKFEKRRRRQKKLDEDPGMDISGSSSHTRGGALRYGTDERSPLEAVFDEDSLSSSDDDDEPPEATGQIKVAMFRVIASGEIKKGEYSPQFDAHDDSEDEAKNASNGGIDADVEHTTSFAKPKTLDPKTISTQTVTGIDGPDRPFAVFTFFYRGERQLQKMGVMAPPKPQVTSPTALKRRSGQLDFSGLGPLKTTGTVGFSTFRDRDSQPARKKKSRKSNGGMSMDADSDDDDDDESDAILAKMEDVDTKYDKSKLGPDDAKFTGELADGVNRIRLKRAHSAEPDNQSSPRKSPSTGAATPPEGSNPAGAGNVAGVVGMFGGRSLPDDNIIGSPMKKARPSIGDIGDLKGSPGGIGGTGTFAPALGDILAKAEAAQASKNQAKPEAPLMKMDEEEEL